MCVCVLRMYSRGAGSVLFFFRGLWDFVCQLFIIPLLSSRSNKNNDIVLWRFSILSVLARLFFSFSLSFVDIRFFPTSYFPPSLSACFIWVVVSNLYPPTPSWWNWKKVEREITPCDCIVKLFIITINIIIIITIRKVYNFLIVYPPIPNFFSPPPPPSLVFSGRKNSVLFVCMPLFVYL